MQVVNESAEEKRKRSHWLNVTATVLVLIPVLVQLGLVNRAPEPISQLRTDSQLKTHSDARAASQFWADESRCIECHEQAERFASTGHARTLSRANASDSAMILSALESSAIGVAENVAVQIEDSGIMIQSGHGQTSKQEFADWCFGSGAHARTWVGTLSNSMCETESLEFRWTWYRSTGSFDVTPGQPQKQGLAGLSQLGLQFDAPRTWRCFSCHSTQLDAKDGELNEMQLVAGVTCQRCHGPRGRHVETEGQWHDVAWIPVDREDSIRRCAECHRSPDEQTRESIRPDNRDLVRFQPVGLVQSECYKQSQMTCTTCHNPHRPLDEQDSQGKWQCIQCHDPEKPEHHLCANGQTDECIRCHMPGEQADSPVSFSDHWIRVHDSSEKVE